MDIIRIIQSWFKGWGAGDKGNLGQGGRKVLNGPSITVVDRIQDYTPGTPVKTSYLTPEAREQNALLFREMEVLKEFFADALSIVHRIQSQEGVYRQVASGKLANVPWYFVGIIHYLECDLSFKKHLHNGDPLTARTKQVPEGRPVAKPKSGSLPYSFLESAQDALLYEGYDKRTGWSIGDMLWLLEGFNGYGYRRYHHMFSPYLWSGTQFYEKGKYTQDNEFNPNAVSKQVGCAILLKLFIS